MIVFICKNYAMFRILATELLYSFTARLVNDKISPLKKLIVCLDNFSALFRVLLVEKLCFTEAAT
jgi:hypothetical protein